MIRNEVWLLTPGLAIALIAGIAAAFLPAAPAQAQRASVNSLASDHDDILDTLDRGPAQIGACGTIDTPGPYLVTQNLAAVGDCLYVTADNVKIDLGGHVLSGDGTGAGVTSNSSDDFHRRGVDVRNGTVTGFSNGILFVFHDSTVLEGVRAIDNAADGLSLPESLYGTVAGNEVLDNGGTGIVGLSFGAIVGNTVARSGSDGIGGGGNNRVVGNTVTESGRFGIDTGASIITGNLVRSSTFIGINAKSSNTVTGNFVEFSGTRGILAQSGSTVSGNTVRNSGGDGIFVVCPSNVIGNTAKNSTGNNLVLSGAGCNDVNNVAP